MHTHTEVSLAAIAVAGFRGLSDTHDYSDGKMPEQADSWITPLVLAGEVHWPWI